MRTTPEAAYITKTYSLDVACDVMVIPHEDSGARYSVIQDDVIGLSRVVRAVDANDRVIREKKFSPNYASKDGRQDHITLNRHMEDTAQKFQRQYGHFRTPQLSSFASAEAMRSAGIDVVQLDGYSVADLPLLLGAIEKLHGRSTGCNVYINTDESAQPDSPSEIAVFGTGEAAFWQGYDKVLSQGQYAFDVEYSSGTRLETAYSIAGTVMAEAVDDLYFK